MKQTIRKGVFETNSSSVHTLTICKDSNRSYPQSLYLYSMDFGWEEHDYTDAAIKASYIYTYLKNCVNDDSRLDLFIQTLRDAGVNVNVEEDDGIIDREWHCIDHYEDLSDFMDAIFSDKELLLDFIFNPNSELVTGNDNCCDMDYLKREASDNLLVFEKGN